jgi:CRISPR/Cas system CSM-associated protein Csm2 small subunit
MGILDKVFEKHKANTKAVKDLTKPPNRKNETKPQFRASGAYPAGKYHQMDLLFLPEDVGGDKYLLVVTDIGSGKTDARPISNKTGKEVLKQVNDIYKVGKYLKKPNYIHIDAGTEFNLMKNAYLKEKIGVRVASTARHRQQGHVESMNRVIGETINKIQLNNAIATDEDDQEQRDWIEYLPDILEAINEREMKPIKKHPPMNSEKAQVSCKDKECETFGIGDKVRVLLDYPQSIDGKRLHGDKFRSGDVKWSVKPYTIENILILPNMVIRYVVKGIETNSFSKFELQPFKKSVATEVMPLPKIDMFLEQGIQNSKKEKDSKHHGDTIWLIKYKNGDEQWTWRLDFIEKNRKFFDLVEKPPKTNRIDGKTYLMNKEAVKYKNGESIQALVDAIPADKKFVLTNSAESIEKFKVINEST